MPEIASERAPGPLPALQAERQHEQLSPVPSHEPVDRPEVERPPSALPILTVPVADGELFHATLVWNLALEMAGGGHRAVLLAPGGRRAHGLWPRPGSSGGVELLLPRAPDLHELGQAAQETARSLYSPDPSLRGVVLVAAPPSWLRQADRDSPLLRWVLLLASPVRRGLAGTAALLRSVFELNPGAEVCFAAHGARSALEVDWIEQQLVSASPGSALPPRYCGRVANDLPVTRALAAKRPLREFTAPGDEAASSIRQVVTSLLESSACPLERRFADEQPGRIRTS